MADDDYPLFAPLLLDRPDGCEEPWFEPLLMNLEKDPLRAPIIHTNANGVEFAKVVGDPEFGMASADDFDIIVRLASIVMLQKRAGIKYPPKDIYFHEFGFLKDGPKKNAETAPQPDESITKKKGSHKGGTVYKKFDAKLRRLHRTNITILKDGNYHTFPWLIKYDELTSDVGENTLATTVRLPDFLWDRIVQDDSVVSLQPSYLECKGGWDRWLSLVSRQVACDRVACIPQYLLKAHTAYSGEDHIFRRDFKKTKLPGYNLYFRQERKKTPFTLHIDPI